MRTRTDRWIASLGITLLVGMACLSLVACRLNTASAEGNLSASATNAKSLVVRNENGSVSIVKDPAATDLQVSAKFRCAAESREAAEARVKATKLVAERGADGRVQVQVVFPSRAPGAVNRPFGWNDSQDAASLVIRAATLDGIEVTTSNGSITLGAFSGPAELRASNGSIRVDGHAGPLEMDTSNGAITAVGVGTPLVADTSNGRVEVSLAPTATGDVKIDTSNGRVELQLPIAWQGTVRAETSNGSIETNVSSAMASTRVEQREDEATMTIGDGTRARATIDTSNGRVTIRAETK
ncbi:MAG: DUF4097 family beta strand repeat-containing protein [Phycisphaerales bacterium]